MKLIIRKKQGMSNKQPSNKYKYILEGSVTRNFRVYISESGGITAYKKNALKFNSVKNARQYILFTESFEICKWNIYGIKLNQWYPVVVN